MSEHVQQPGDYNQELRELADRERELKVKLQSFKKELKANEGLDPDYVGEQYAKQKARFDEEMKLISEQREQIVIKSMSRLKKGGP